MVLATRRRDQARPSVTFTAPIRLSPSPFWRMASTSIRHEKRASTISGVPPAAATGLEDLIDLPGCEALAIDAVARHGIERVGDREDPGLERDLLAREMIGISCPVQALVVVPHSGQDVVQLLQVLEDGDSNLHVGLNLLVFLGCQRTALLEHKVVDADLADIVEQTGEVKIASLLRRTSPALSPGDRRSWRPALNAPTCKDPWRRWPLSGPG